MATDYRSIADDNRTRYGTDVAEYGPTLLSDRYSDRTHFVFELLQNAEDALRKRRERAGSRFSRCVTFALLPDRLEIRHHGIPFDHEDVGAICQIAKSTKRKERMEIGQFGIGFKSVYSFTHSPEVHSGDEHFVIKSFVHPNAASARPLGDGETLFILPFDHPEVDRADAVAEIAGRLQHLAPTTLLFLREIEKVAWELPDASSGYLSRSVVDKSDDWRRVRLERGGGARSVGEHWLTFESPVEPAEGAVMRQQFRAEIAFRLDGAGRKAPIRPIENAKLVAYFPTEKVTHTGFLIQGPFKTTPARDNVPFRDAWNKRLVNSIAELTCRALVSLRGMGLLTVSALEAMPLQSSDFPEDDPEDAMFRPVFERVCEALRADSLIPASPNGFVSGNYAKIARSEQLRKLLNDQQLAKLYQTNDPLRWISDGITPDRTPRLYALLKDEIGVEQVSPEDFVARVSEAFIPEQTDAWMARFFAFLGNNESLWRWSPHSLIRSIPIVRLEDRRHVKPLNVDGSRNAYLPGDTEAPGLPIVRRQTIKIKAAEEFLRKVGLAEPDVVDTVIRFCLPRYEAWKNPDLELIGATQHQRDLGLILKAAKAATGTRADQLKGLLRQLRFLRARNAVTKAVALMSPEQVYRRTKHLTIYTRGSEAAWFLMNPHPGWMRQYGERFRTLCRDLGVADLPRRIPVSVSSSEKQQLRGDRPHSREISAFDYDLDGLEPLLERIEKQPRKRKLLSRLLWQLLVKCAKSGRGEFFQGVYNWGDRRTSYSERFDARFCKSLRNRAWLLTKTGQLRKSMDICALELHPTYPRDDVIEEVLKFRPDTMALLAEEAGIPIELLNRVREDPKGAASYFKNKDRQRAAEAEARAGAKLQVEYASTAQGSAAQQPPAQTKPSNSARLAARPDEGVNAEDGSLKPPASSDGATSPSPSEARNKSGQAAAASTRNRPGHPSQRLLSYVSPPSNPNTDDGHSPSPRTVDDRSDDEADEDRILGARGEKIVLKLERERGRVPQWMRESQVNNPGFDIKSFEADQSERFIEVKTINGEWSELGVALSARQFEMAMGKENQYWLYVVEIHCGESDIPVYMIQNPARKITKHMYDVGWKEAAELATGTD